MDGFIDSHIPGTLILPRLLFLVQLACLMGWDFMYFSFFTNLNLEYVLIYTFLCNAA